MKAQQLCGSVNVLDRHIKELYSFVQVVGTLLLVR
jgi:hypothetical protein